MLPYLLDQIPADEIVASVSGDSAYDTKSCHEEIAKRGAQAIIPSRKTPSYGRTRALVPQPTTPFGGYAPAWQTNLEEVERLSRAQPWRDQDAMLQAAW
jgi:hypothetical protein